MYKIGILVAAVLFVIMALYMASVAGDHATHDMDDGDHSAQLAMITSERAFL